MVDTSKIPRAIELVELPAAACGASEEGCEEAPRERFCLVLLDQTKLPYEEEYLHIDDWCEVVDAIKTLKVRGAPAIGIAGLAALALCAQECVSEIASGASGCDPSAEGAAVQDTSQSFLDALDSAASVISNARPTAVNLSLMVSQGMELVSRGVAAGKCEQAIADELFDLTQQAAAEDELACRAIGDYGAELLPADATVLTHCNAGSLATSFYGTALGVIYSTAQTKGVARVYADETRPVGQGARLTVWELAKAGVPVSLICDDMAASVMQNKGVDAVIVGADRIAANGDVANKIGTLGVAIMAKHFGIPFYVAAPTTTIDIDTLNGSEIVIEHRGPKEVLERAIDGVDVFNPAFDVTPANLITAIITEKGVFAPSDIRDSLKG